MPWFPTMPCCCCCCITVYGLVVLMGYCNDGCWGDIFTSRDTLLTDKPLPGWPGRTPPKSEDRNKCSLFLHAHWSILWIHNVVSALFSCFSNKERDSLVGPMPGPRPRCCGCAAMTGLLSDICRMSLMMFCLSMGLGNETGRGSQKSCGWAFCRSFRMSSSSDD